MKKQFFFLFLLAVSAVAIPSCKKEERTVPVQFRLTDNPTNYEEVNVDIRAIRVNFAKDTAGWIDIPTKAGVYNLLDFQNGIDTVLAEGEVPDAFMKEVRFVLGPNNTVKVNGAEYPLITPSAEHSGLKVKIDKDLEQSLNAFTLDFDAALSVKEENGTYRLDPVIKLKD